MANKPRSPLTEVERQQIRDLFMQGKTNLEIARMFSCSTRTVEKLCVRMRPRASGPGVGITIKQIEQIAELRREGIHIAEISRMVGVSITSVTRYSPRELKRVSSIIGGTVTSDRKREKRDQLVATVLAAMPASKPKYKAVDELPDSVRRMIKSMTDTGHKEELARSWAIAYYNKNRKP